MELPIEHIADVVATLRMQHDRSARERRHLPRFPVWAPATVFLQKTGRVEEPLEVSLTNLGCGGVGILSPRRLEAGQPFHITLPATDAPPLAAACHVVYSSPAGPEAFFVGARFDATLSAGPGSDAAAPGVAG